MLQCDLASNYSQAVMDIGKTMRLTTVAERIETRRQLHELQGLDCSLGQGFLFSHPLPANAIRQLLASAHDFAQDTRSTVGVGGSAAS